MKKSLFTTVGIALALFLTGCPTGTDSSVGVSYSTTVISPNDLQGNGKVIADPTKARAGDTVTLTVSDLDEGRQVTLESEQVVLDPAVFAADGNVTYIMPAKDVTITATFEEVAQTIYTVTITSHKAETSESVTVDTMSTAEKRVKEEVTLSVSGLTADRQVVLTAIDEVTFSNLDGEISSPAIITANGNITFTMPTTDVTITATFMPIPAAGENSVIINYDGEDQGEEVISNPVESAAEGTTVTLTAAGLAEGRRVTLESDQVTFDPAVLTPESLTATFSMPDEAVVITAAFVSIYDVTLDLVPEDINDGETVSADLSKALESDEVTLMAAGLAEGRQVTLASDQVTFSPAVLTSATPTTTFTMPAGNVSITATFGDILYSVTMDFSGESGAESISAERSEAVKDTSVTLSVSGLTADRQVVLTAIDEVTFSNLDGEISSPVIITANGDITFTMPATDVTITATFMPIPAAGENSVIINYDGEDQGEEVISNPVGSAAEGTTVTLTAAGLAEGRQVTLESDQVTFDPAVLTPESLTATFSMPDEAVVITAAFGPRLYGVSLSLVHEDPPNNGETVSADLSEAAENDEVTLNVSGLTEGRQVTFTSDAGGTFDETVLTVDGNVKFTMPAGAVIITAAFGPRLYGVSLSLVHEDSPNNGETVSVDLSEAAENDEVTLNVSGLTEGRQVTFTSDAGGTFDKTVLTVNGNVKFTMPAGAVIITAAFGPRLYGVSLSLVHEDPPNNGETVSVDLSEAAENDEVTLNVSGLTEGRQVTFTSDAGGTFDKTVLTVNGNVKFTMPAGAVVITAAFGPRLYGVSLSLVHEDPPNNGETVSADLSEAAENDEVTLNVSGLTEGRQVTFTSDAGVTFDKTVLTVNGNVKFTMPAEDVIITATFAFIPTYTVIMKPHHADPGEEITSTNNLTGIRAGDEVILTINGLTDARQVTLASNAVEVLFVPAVITANKDVRFTMPAKDVTISATFTDIPTYTVELIPDGADSGEEVSRTNNLTRVKAGDEVTLTVAGLGEDRQVKFASNAGGTFDETVLRANGDVRFIMPAEDVIITATFTEVYYKVIIDIQGAIPGAESITVIPEALAGWTINLSVSGLVAGRQVTFNSDSPGVFDSSTVHTPGSTTAFEMPAEDVTIQAVFSGQSSSTYDVIVDDSTADNGESIITDKTKARAGEIFTLTVDGLTEGRQVTLESEQVTFDPAVFTANGEATFTMPGKAVNITATFADTYSVTVINHGDDMEMVTANRSEAADGDTVILTVSGLGPIRQVSFTSDAGGTFDKTVVTANGEVMFTMPDEAVIITATFGNAIYSVDVDYVTEGNGESVIADLSEAIESNIVTLTVDGLTEGRQVTLESEQVTFDPAVFIANGEATFTMPGEAVIITATFADTYSVMVTNDGDDMEMVTTNRSEAAENDEVTLTVSGLAENRKVTLSAMSEDRLIVAVTPAVLTAEGETATFIMPNKAVTITATFEEIPQTYRIRIDNKGNFEHAEEEVTTDVARAAEGDIIILTVRIPDVFTVLRQVVLTSDAGGTFNPDTPHTVDGTVEFTMPAANVIITATYGPAPSQ